MPKKKTQDKPRNKGGRPSVYSDAILEKICARLSKGEPLAAICRDDGMPHPNTVRDWISRDEHVSVAIAQARENGEDWLAAECLQIADTPVDGVRTKEGLDGTEIWHEDMIQHRKLQIETRLKLLAKWNPRKWGDKIQQEVSGSEGGPVQIVVNTGIRRDAAD